MGALGDSVMGGGGEREAARAIPACHRVELDKPTRSVRIRHNATQRSGGGTLGAHLQKMGRIDPGNLVLTDHRYGSDPLAESCAGAHVTDGTRIRTHELQELSL